MFIPEPFVLEYRLLTRVLVENFKFGSLLHSPVNLLLSHGRLRRHATRHISDDSSLRASQNRGHTDHFGSNKMRAPLGALQVDSDIVPSTRRAAHFYCSDTPNSDTFMQK